MILPKSASDVVEPPWSVRLSANRKQNKPRRLLRSPNGWKSGCFMEDQELKRELNRVEFWIYLAYNTKLCISKAIRHFFHEFFQFFRNFTAFSPIFSFSIFWDFGSLHLNDSLSQIIHNLKLHFFLGFGVFFRVLGAFLSLGSFFYVFGPYTTLLGAIFRYLSLFSRNSPAMYVIKR